jgi:hypothetical protein
MSDKDRVARWRQGMRDQGKEPVTLWLSSEDKQRMEDLAHLGRCTTSEIASQALAAFQPESPERTSNVTDTEQLRGMVNDMVLTLLDTELPGRLGALAQTLNTPAPVTDTETNRNVSVTPTQQGTRARKRNTSDPVPELETFDPNKHYLGDLCQRGHDYQGTGQSLRNLAAGNCLACKTETQRERRKAKREAGGR